MYIPECIPRGKCARLLEIIREREKCLFSSKLSFQLPRGEMTRRHRPLEATHIADGTIFFRRKGRNL